MQAQIRRAVLAYAAAATWGALTLPVNAAGPDRMGAPLASIDAGMCCVLVQAPGPDGRERDDGGPSADERDSPDENPDRGIWRRLPGDDEADGGSDDAAPGAPGGDDPPGCQFRNRTLELLV